MAVTPATLKDIFPDFADVADATVHYWLDRALRLTADWDDDHATMLLAAHYLAINGFGAGGELTKLSGLSSLQSGSLSLSFKDDGTQERGARHGVAKDWNRTIYGVQFQTLLNARTPILPMVTGA